jgi:dihydrofolate reductase
MEAKILEKILELFRNTKTEDLKPIFPILKNIRYFESGDPIVTAIALVGKKGEIAVNDDMPDSWNVKEDKKRFFALTKGTCCIVGRKTFEKFPDKQKHSRIFFVVSGTTPDSYENPMVYYFPTFASAIETAKALFMNISIIGGGHIYSAAFDGRVVDKVILSRAEDLVGYSEPEETDSLILFPENMQDKQRWFAASVGWIGNLFREETYVKRTAP